MRHCPSVQSQGGSLSHLCLKFQPQLGQHSDSWCHGNHSGGNHVHDRVNGERHRYRHGLAWFGGRQYQIRLHWVSLQKWLGQHEYQLSWQGCVKERVGYRLLRWQSHRHQLRLSHCIFRRRVPRDDQWLSLCLVNHGLSILLIRLPLRLCGHNDG